MTSPQNATQPMDNVCGPDAQPEATKAEFTALGYYEPGFIHLKINTQEDLNDLDHITNGARYPAWSSTFLHEYIHFLQDITSTHGLLNFIHAIEYLRNANKQVRELTDATFKTPLKIRNDFNWQTNARLKAIYRGDDEPAKSIRYLCYRSTSEAVASSNGEKIAPSKYFVDYYDSGAHSKATCHFGSIHLKEYMAHAIQKQFDPARIHGDAPYRLVELLIEGEIPEFAGSPSLMIALCDAALMS